MPLRAALVSFLGAAGARVLAAPDAEVAIEFLTTSPVDALLTDLQLPGWSGIELSEWILENRPAVPVVLMSASLLASGTSLPASVRRFVRKPFDPDTFLAILRAIVAAPSGEP